MFLLKLKGLIDNIWKTYVPVKQLSGQVKKEWASCLNSIIHKINISNGENDDWIALALFAMEHGMKPIRREECEVDEREGQKGQDGSFIYSRFTEIVANFEEQTYFMEKRLCG